MITEHNDCHLTAALKDSSVKLTEVDTVQWQLLSHGTMCSLDVDADGRVIVELRKGVEGKDVQVRVKCEVENKRGGKEKQKCEKAANLVFNGTFGKKRATIKPSHYPHQSAPLNDIMRPKFSYSPLSKRNTVRGTLENFHSKSPDLSKILNNSMLWTKNSLEFSTPRQTYKRRLDFSNKENIPGTVNSSSVVYDSLSIPVHPKPKILETSSPRTKLHEREIFKYLPRDSNSINIQNCYLFCDNGYIK